jgi:hypothetical protein
MPRSVDDIRQVNENIGSDPVLPRGFGVDHNETAYPFYPAPRAALVSGGHNSWFFGGALTAQSATAVLSRPASAAVSIRFGTISADGGTHWGQPVTAPPGASRVTARLPRGDAVGLTLQVLGTLPAHRVVITANDRPYELGGSLSAAVVPGPWRQAETAQGYAVFVFRQPPEPISAVTSTGRRLPVQVLSSTAKSEELRVRAPTGAQVIRSVAWDSGWTGSVSVNGGPSRAVSVGQIDLVQEIRVPPGDDVVTFHYRPPHLLVASVLTLGATAFLVVLLVVWVFRRRRRPADEAVIAQEAVPAEEPVPVEG